MDVVHEMLPDGESTKKWAFNEPGFAGTIKQLICCARCGRNLPPKRPDEKIRIGHLFKPTVHVLCDECFDALP